MGTMIDALQGQLGGDAQAQLARQLGVDNATAGRVVQAALPTLVAGLQHNTRMPDGAKALHSALQTGHDGVVLDDVAGYLSAGGDPSDGAAILGHVFGARQQGVVDGVGGAAAVNSQVLQQAMAMLAPLVLAYLGKRVQSGGLDSGGLKDVLAKESLPTAGQTGGAGDLGSVLGSLLEGMQGGAGGSATAPAGGLLGKLLSSILGRPRSR